MPINDLYRPTILLQMMCKGWEERRRVGANKYVIFSYNFYKSSNSKRAKDATTVCVEVASLTNICVRDYNLTPFGSTIINCR